MQDSGIWKRSRSRVAASFLDVENRDSVIIPEMINKFFYSDFDSIYHRTYEHGIPNFKNNVIDGVLEYTANSMGYRGPEFSKDTEIIFAGDSNSYGVGLPDRYMWTNIVGKHYGLSYVNLSVPGASAQTCVENVILYIKKYGKPKSVVCAFPDLGRMTAFSNNSTVTSHQRPNNVGLMDIQLEPYADLRDIPSFLKKPYEVEYTIPIELAIYLSLKSIQHLEDYCKLSGINLYWTSFSNESHYLLKKLSENQNGYYELFVDTEQDRWADIYNDSLGDRYYDSEWFNIDREEIVCHEDLIDDMGQLFHAAGDIDHSSHKSAKAHYGAHRNLHLANSFIARMDSHEGN